MGLESGAVASHCAVGVGTAPGAGGGAGPDAAPPRLHAQHHDRGHPGYVPAPVRPHWHHLEPVDHPQSARLVRRRSDRHLERQPHLRTADHPGVRGTGGDSAVVPVPAHPDRCVDACRGGRSGAGLDDRCPLRADRRSGLDHRLHGCRTGRDPGGTGHRHEPGDPLRAGHLRVFRRHRGSTPVAAADLPRCDDPGHRRVDGHRLRAGEPAEQRVQCPTHGAVDHRAAAPAPGHPDSRSAGTAPAPPDPFARDHADRRPGPHRPGHPGRLPDHRGQPLHRGPRPCHRHRRPLARFVVGLRRPGVAVPVHLHGYRCMGDDQGRRRGLHPRRAGRHRPLRCCRGDPGPSRPPPARSVHGAGHPGLRRPDGRDLLHQPVHCHRRLDHGGQARSSSG